MRSTYVLYLLRIKCTMEFNTKLLLNKLLNIVKFEDDFMEDILLHLNDLK